MTEKADFREQLLRNLGKNEQYAEDLPNPLSVADLPVRLIAFFLPQFHQIPENDAWWGKGYTEWTNVSKALPQFEGHYQPHLPGELGFYNLSAVKSIRQQAAMAKKFGIYGFCFHYYWFSGKRLLEKPLDLFLSHQDIDMPFCICWANESWTRRWDGLDNEVLIAQRYSSEDDLAFAQALEPIVRDPRYIHVKGRPLIVVYRPDLIPDALATTRRWRVHFARVGLANPLLVTPIGFGVDDPRLYGFDAAVEFPPHIAGGRSFGTINHSLNLYNPDLASKVYDYQDMVRAFLNQPERPFKLFRGVCPGWDNEARKPGKAFTFAFSTPENYGNWLRAACRDALMAEDETERIVFINAWNEWGEGAHLEPDRHFGYAHLRETAKVLNELPGDSGNDENTAERPRLAIISHDARFHGAQMLILHVVEALSRHFGVDVRVTLAGPGELKGAFTQAALTETIEGEFLNPKAWIDLAQCLKRESCMAVICNTILCGQQIQAFKEAGLRTILLVHELPGLIEERGLLPAAINAVQYADVLVFPSDFVRQSFEALIKMRCDSAVVRPQGVYILPGSPDEYARNRSVARRSLGAKVTTRIILGVGYGDRRKGIDFWPALIKQVVSIHPNALFVWVGRIDENLLVQMKKQLQENGLEEHFRLENPTRKLQPLYAAADLFALTSREDPFPNVALEAMAQGLPVLAFENSSGITSLVQECGAPLAPAYDIDAMAKNCCRLLRNEELRFAISQKCREYVEKDHDFSAYVSDLLGLANAVKPKISVVVPNFNYARYLPKRMESIWSQTYPIHEILVLDDASTDNSLSVLEDLRRLSPIDFRVIRNSNNSGSVSSQWAKGVSLATGDLVWIAEADDFAEPEFLAATSQAFADSRVVLSYCQSRQIDGEGNVLAQDYLDYVADIDPVRWRSYYHRSGRGEIAEALSIKNTVPNVSAVLFRRGMLAQILDEHIGEMSECQNAADWLCYLWLAREGFVAFTPQSLNNHRRHQHSVTLAANDKRHLEEIGAMQRLAASLAPVSAEHVQMAQQWYNKVERQFNLAALPASP